MNNKIVRLKISNGHQIWIFKKLVNGYKYYGIYDKAIAEDDLEDGE